MIRIVQASSSQLRELPQFDLSFVVESELRLAFAGDQFTYEVEPVPPYETLCEPCCPVHDPSHVAFIAEFETQAVGRIDLSVKWNGLGYIHLLAVDRKCRRHGVATMLLRKALEWSQAEKLPGIMLETQHNNVPACKLYERRGFRIGGFDRNLYRGLHPHTADIAVFWYWWSRDGQQTHPADDAN